MGERTRDEFDEFLDVFEWRQWYLDVGIDPAVGFRDWKEDWAEQA